MGGAAEGRDDGAAKGWASDGENGRVEDGANGAAKDGAEARYASSGGRFPTNRDASGAAAGDPY